MALPLLPQTSQSIPPPYGRGRALLITDLDNTLYDFPRYYEAGLQAVVLALTNMLDLPESDVICQLREVFTRRGSVEYPFAVQEMDAVSRLPKVDARTLSLETTNAFWEAARGDLITYPTVYETLELLSRERVSVVALTDAPYREALRRLHHLRIEQFFSAVVALDWFGAHRSPAVGIRLSDVPGYVRRRPTQLGWKLKLEDRKPNRGVISALARRYRHEGMAQVAVGDSFERDLAPALELGMTCLHAGYGSRSISDGGLLLKVVPSILPEVRRSSVPHSAASVVSINRFEEALAYLPVQQRFDFQ